MKKRRRRLTGVDEVILPLCAQGLTHGEISAHLAEAYEAGVSKQTISTITDSVMEGMAEWQARPLERAHVLRGMGRKVPVIVRLWESQW